MTNRRDLLRLAAGAVLGTTVGCGAPGAGPGERGPGGGGADVPTRRKGSVERVDYGPDPAQYGELYRPEGSPRGVVVVIHGGFWRARYDLELGVPLAADLAAHGWVAWNLEYRRLGNGGGVPQTLDDVAAGVDRLASVDGLEEALAPGVLTLGHSAGGHLATWAAARDRYPRWSPTAVPVAGVVAQAGVLDLAAAHRDGLGNGAVAAFLGRPPAEVDDLARYDPVRQVPLSVPVHCVHAPGDDTVPIEQSRRYVAAAREAGADAEVHEVPGDHYTLIDPGSQAWRRTREMLTGLRDWPGE